MVQEHPHKWVLSTLIGMSRNWIDRGEQMRYSGRYPINEMWNTRQSLMNDLRRNLTLNKYLTSIERKCSDFVFEKRNKRSNWKRSATCTVSKDPEDKVLEDKSQERREPEDSSGYFNDDPNVDISSEIENETSTLKPTNTEFIIKEEPSPEQFDINTENSELDINFPGNLEKNQSDQIESQTEESNLLLIPNLNIEIKSEESYETEQTMHTKDVEDCFTEENPFDFQEISQTKCDEIDSGLDKKSDESGTKTKNCKEKSITYKDFVRSVSKLVSDSESSKSEKIQNSGKICGKLKKTKKVKSPNSKKDGDVDKTIRSTRSSIKGKKVHNVEKNRTKKEEEKKVRNKTERTTATNTLKLNKQKTKSKSRYSTRSQRKEKDSEEESVHEEPSASISKQKEYPKRKISCPADEDIPLAKYTKLLHHNEETKVKDLLKGATDFDKAIPYSPDSCAHSNDKTEKDVDKSKTNQIDKSDSESKVKKMKKESSLQTSLILINDSDSDKQQNTTNQTASRKLDSLNNNTDMKQEKSSSHVQGEETWSSSHENDQLWEYLKCDFCDFMVSKKKEQSYQLMEEHLESTKHNAASIVKISISDGELKPVFVKKEHAILLSLEKATILPYCPTCCTVMPSIWTVQLHAKYKHGENSNYDKDKYCLGKIENVVNIPIPRKINVCKKCGLKKNNIQEHWETHNHFPYDLPSSNQIAQFSCSACNRYFDSFSSALSHAVAHEKHDKLQNDGVIITYITKSEQVLTLLPREKTLSNGRALEILNQAKLANKQGQWTRAQRKEFEMMAVDWKRCFKQY